MSQLSILRALRAALFTLAVFTGLVSPVRAADAATTATAPAADQAAFFDGKIRPILEQHCYECHSHKAEKIKGGFLLDSRAALLTGGNSGAVVVPGKPAESLLIKAVSYTDPDLQMPPKGKRLSGDQVALLTEWVKQGLPWPGSKDEPVVAAKSRFTDADRAYWAFQPVREPKVPAVEPGGWAINAIDRFILHKLKAEGLQPAPPADRVALIRRATFDLSGLPPTPEEVAAFVSDASPQAYEKVVQRLLDSPRYGERWARHWLDLVRYAESDGYKADDERPNAWRYRDYVIQSFNHDKPYDRFILEQLAGDEIAPTDPEALVATGYLRHWIYEYNQRNVAAQWEHIVNDVTDVTGDVFLGLGMQCARCHDHKFDPILQKDYYRLQAFFAPMLPRDDLPLATPQQWMDYKTKLAQWESLTAEIRAQIDKIVKPHEVRAARSSVTKFPEEIQAMINKPPGERAPLEQQLAELAWRQVTYEYDRLETKLKGEEKTKLDALKKQLAEFDRYRPEPLPQAMLVTDVGPFAPPTVIAKGRNKGPVEPGFLSVLDEAPAHIERVPSAPNSTGRRTALARWLASPENPLTARVIVNRLWQYHFGRGLAAVTSDLGHLGDAPTHPELLDCLAARFVRDGWSLKKLHRLIMTSATYRQSAGHPMTETAQMKDPENRWLWRMNPRRLDAEQIRDAMLSVSGDLDLTDGGASVDSARPRRTIYTKLYRNKHDPLLDLFDAPDGYSSTPKRNATTSPVQSLLLINGDWTLARAAALASKLPTGDTDASDFVKAAYQRVYGRSPSAGELVTARAFLHEQARRIAPKTDGLAGPLTGELPGRSGKAARFESGTSQSRLQIPDNPSLPAYDFTVEAFVVLNSLYEDAAVRTIAARWDSKTDQPGWSFGVTSQKSAYTPRNLILQLVGDQAEDGVPGYEVVPSGLHLELGRPYYVAVTVRLADTTKAGVTFYVKDLARPEEPMQVAGVPHKVTATHRSNLPLVIGGRDNDRRSVWDGLIDDLRLSNVALSREQLLFDKPAATTSTVGYWRFDEQPGFAKDLSVRGNDIQSQALRVAGSVDPKTTARIDFCHVLLNSNEFLYVE